MNENDEINMYTLSLYNENGRTNRCQIKLEKTEGVSSKNEQSRDTGIIAHTKTDDEDKQNTTQENLKDEQREPPNKLGVNPGAPEE